MHPVGRISEEFIVHVLTKAFVVLAAVLAVALSALVIAYAVNTDRIAAGYRAMQQSKDAADARVVDATTQAEAQRTRLQQQIQDLGSKLAEKESEVRRMQAEGATLRTDKMKAEAARQATENQIKELGETSKTQAAIIENYRSENTTLREAELRAKQQLLDMETRIADLESQREVLDQRYKAIMEQFTELKRQADTALAGGVSTALGGVDQPFVFSGPPIVGRVEEVQRDAATGADLVRLSVGTNDRVQKNMKFLVVRDGQFQANVVVVQADMRWSVARVDSLGRSVSVKAGDIVMSRAD